MNKYCFNLNLNLNPLRENIIIDDLPKKDWNLIPVELINNKLITFLKTKEITVSVVSSFYDPGPHFNQVIHVDSQSICDMTKLIWVWGEYNMMNWYLPKHNNCHATTEANTSDPMHRIRNYSVYNKHSVDMVWSTKIGFPSLIQVGIPHHSINFRGIRRSLTMVLHDFNNDTIPMERAKSIFEPYII